MLKYLELNNFRAFKSEVFKFSKLNIFVGPNNSGKSSVISAINMMAQTLDDPDLNSSPIVINGKFDQLGTFKDMVHGGRASTPIKFAIGVDEYRYEFDIKYRLQRREMELSRFKLCKDGRSVYDYTLGRDRYDVNIQGVPIDQIHHSVKKVRPSFNGFLPRMPMSVRMLRSPAAANKDIGEEVIKFARAAEMDIYKFRSRISSVFESFDSLGAFREMPQRTYLWSGETASNIGRFGQNTVTLLASDSLKRGSEQAGYLDTVSRWLKQTGIAQGIKVKHLTDRHFELVVVGNDRQDHNIADVGFGCSQVLPVLISGLKASRPSRGYTSYGLRGQSTLVIQEPEIHLHPNAQAELGSFFTQVAMNGPQIFIETHSDNLVLRVARHVAAGDISAEDIKIFYIQDVDGIKTVTTMGISSAGGFTPDWPGGFFPQRQEESFALAKAAFSNKSL